LTSQAVDSVDSHKKRACPHYPQPYDDGDDAPLLWVGALGTLPEENHNKHSLKWYSFLGELPSPVSDLLAFVLEDDLAGSAPVAFPSTLIVQRQGIELLIGIPHQ